MWTGFPRLCSLCAIWSVHADVMIAMEERFSRSPTERGGSANPTERELMKQYCHISFIYLSRAIFIGGLVIFIVKGAYILCG